MDLDTIRHICLAFPGATEQLQWEHHLLFKVGGKMFCMTDLDDPARVRFKADIEDFEALVETGSFMPAPHLARANWLLVMHPEDLKLRDWKQHIARSYELVRAKLPKKVQAELGL